MHNSGEYHDWQARKVDGNLISIVVIHRKFHALIENFPEGHPSRNCFYSSILKP